VSIIDDLYSAVAHAVVGIHRGLEPVFGPTNGYGWALSIVLLTMAVRLVLFPLFVKQVKSQRTLQMLQPKMKELREKYKNDKPKLNEELMKLQKEHGNPLLGCLPIFAQIPLFIALFRVLNGFAPRQNKATGAYEFVANHGLSQAQAQTIGSARIFGVPLSAAFRSGEAMLSSFPTAVSPGVTKAVALVLIAIMCTTTFLTQKQVIGRNGPVDPSQRMQQKLFLYLAPVMLGFSGFLFPIGVLIYWMTTNFWSMGQQFFIIRKMPPLVPGQGAPGKGGVQLEKSRAGKDRATGLEAAPDAAAVRLRQSRHNPVPPPVTPTPASTPTAGAAAAPRRPAAARPAAKRKSGKNRRGGRR